MVLIIPHLYTRAFEIAHPQISLIEKDSFSTLNPNSNRTLKTPQDASGNAQETNEKLSFTTVRQLQAISFYRQINHVIIHVTLVICRQFYVPLYYPFFNSILQIHFDRITSCRTWQLILLIIWGFIKLIEPAGFPDLLKNMAQY
ncbi:hypothetical protein CDAR_102301 [Caerostris darwini]|uniref:Uncharacterized protein n=1 Tax=Caerostris darwini TaxID=1538125 RepID=A0AAV4S2T3_9ARAC|nr:hypothetical protein CDAR_102301 [Caerostris darwini]